ncbi:hypothetical protein [Singulisphaera sp. PoT]|uniref:hypothetical protein n=1 Tax=Singulisphaera sp. PoT TaxID=3411797 RepID=UPI003BF4A5AC
MPLRSNLNDVTREVKRLAGCLNMRAKGRKKSIGLDAVEIIVDGVRERTVDGQRSADGSTLGPATLVA